MLHIKVYHGDRLLSEYNDYIISCWRLIMIAKEHNVRVDDLRVDALDLGHRI